MPIHPPKRRLFPPPHRAIADLPPLCHKSDLAVDVLTIGGEIKLRRRYFWSKWEGGVFPADASIGMALTKASPAAREACCTMGVVQDFAQGAEAGTWARQQLHDLKHLGDRPVLAAIDAAKKKLRASAKQKALRLLRNYIVERWEMVEYPAAIAKGWDIGSGSNEPA